MKIYLFLLAAFALIRCDKDQAEIKYLQVDDSVLAKDDIQAIIDPLWWSVSIYDGRQKYESDLSRFSQEQRYVLAIWWYVSEVNNGGHHQFFFNSTGVVWKDVAEGFRATGLFRYAEIARSANELLLPQPSFSRRERQSQLKVQKPDFREIDEQFYTLERSIGIEQALLKYIRAHRKSFYFKGPVVIPR